MLADNADNAENADTTQFASREMLIAARNGNLTNNKNDRRQRVPTTTEISTQTTAKNQLAPTLATGLI